MTLRCQSQGTIRAWRRHFPLASVTDVVELVREILATCDHVNLSSSSTSLDTSILHKSPELTFLAPALASDPISGHPKPENDDKKSLPSQTSPNIPYSKSEPCLAFLSIILGFIENQLTLGTCHQSTTTQEHSSKPARAPTTSRRLSKPVLPTTILRDSGGRFVPRSDDMKIPTESSLSVDTSALPSTAFTLTPTMYNPSSVSNTEAVPSPCSSVSSTSSLSRRRNSAVGSNQVGCLGPASVPPSQEEDDANSTNTSTSHPEVGRSPSSNKKRKISAPVAYPLLVPKASNQFPILTFDDADRLYQDFYNLIMTASKLQCFLPSRSSFPENPSRSASRQLVGAVCDVLWSRMSANRSRERLVHTQSVYSLLTAGLLDSFGLAFATVAACQLLGYSDVHLALSEDHAWVEFGRDPPFESADVVSWLVKHAPSSSPTDALPPPIRLGPFTKSWLYVNGHPVLCRPRVLALAAAVTAMQPAGLGRLTDLSNDNSSTVLASLKHQLLRLIFNANCLSRYPLGLTNLADLEDTFSLATTNLNDPTLTHSHRPTQPGSSELLARPNPIALALYKEAIRVNRLFYANHHVYPYTSLASYLHGKGEYRGALACWTEAAKVVAQYCHSNEDREIYRELLEVATQLMPNMFRQAADDSRSCSTADSVKQDADGCIYQPANVLDDPQCLAHLLSFYDHLCLWEQDSPVPVLHVGWVEKLAVNLTRFSQRARRHLCLNNGSLSQDEDAESGSLQAAEPLSSFGRAKRSRTLSSASSASPAVPSKTRQIQNIDSLSGERSTVKRTHTEATRLQEPSRPVIVNQAPNVETSNKQRRVLQDLTTAANPRAHATQNLDPNSTPLLATTPAKMDNQLDQPPLTTHVDPHLATAIQCCIDQCPHNFVTCQGEELEDASPSPPPHVEFPYCTASSAENDTEDLSVDIFTILVDSCDQRLFNPAFLWGVDTTSPFLPPDGPSPEDIVSQLSSSASGQRCLEPSNSRTIDAPSDGSPQIADDGPASIESPFKGTVADDEVPNDVVESVASLVADSPLDFFTFDLLTDTDSTEKPSIKPTVDDSPSVELTLYSVKMTSIIDLLRAPRLNSSAIKLTLTAQSQVNFRRAGRSLML